MNFNELAQQCASQVNGVVNVIVIAASVLRFLPLVSHRRRRRSIAVS